MVSETHSAGDLLRRLEEARVAALKEKPGSEAEKPHARDWQENFIKLLELFKPFGPLAPPMFPEPFETLELLGPKKPLAAKALQNAAIAAEAGSQLNKAVIAVWPAFFNHRLEHSVSGGFAYGMGFLLYTLQNTPLRAAVKLSILNAAEKFFPHDYSVAAYEKDRNGINAACGAANEVYARTAPGSDNERIFIVFNALWDVYYRLDPKEAVQAVKSIKKCYGGGEMRDQTVSWLMEKGVYRKPGQLAYPGQANNYQLTLEQA